jgi:serine/threonine-protein kinase
MHRDPQQFLQAALGGRYRIERLLGTGGTAAVYLAHDPRHDRQVAIKVLRPEVALALGADRFLREIRIAARLNHPHILPLHDSGEADGLLYYVMPFVAGESVRDRLVRQRQVELDDAVRIAREVASALSHAHAQGIIHRDIKPENILLQDGMALVADFGLARALTEAKEGNITETGLVMGTPAYMSPEQASGSPTVDARTDIYALGCVLYEMLSGNPPFPGENAAVVLAHHISDPVPPLRTPQHIPRDVIEAVMTALAKRPEDRFQSASQFMRALDQGNGYGRRRRLSRLARAAGLALILALAALGLFRGVPAISTAVRGLLGAPTDPGAWLVLSTAAKPDSLQATAVNGIRTALARWQDLMVVDPAGLPSRAQLGPPEDLSPAEARYKAQRLGAGRLVLVEATRDADSLLVHARVLDVAADEEIGRASAGSPTGWPWASPKVSRWRRSFWRHGFSPRPSPSVTASGGRASGTSPVRTRCSPARWNSTRDIRRRASGPGWCAPGNRSRRPAGGRSWNAP